jgi:hypothetical protein
MWQCHGSNTHQYWGSFRWCKWYEGFAATRDFLPWNSSHHWRVSSSSNAAGESGLTENFPNKYFLQR